MSELDYRYCLSQNDLDIIKQYNGNKKLSKNAEKTLIILSEVFGGLHHLDYDQLELFDYQSRSYNEYLLHGSLATFDGMELTCLVIIAHDMAVRFEIQSHRLDPEDEYDLKLLKMQVKDFEDYKITVEEFAPQSRPYIKLLFHQRKRDGRFYERHPTLEDSTDGFRKNNKRYA
jgi:hypothetical protein